MNYCTRTQKLKFGPDVLTPMSLVFLLISDFVNRNCEGSLK